MFPLRFLKTYRMYFPASSATFNCKGKKDAAPQKLLGFLSKPQNTIREEKGAEFIDTLFVHPI